MMRNLLYKELKQKAKEIQELNRRLEDAQILNEEEKLTNAATVLEQLSGILRVDGEEGIDNYRMKWDGNVKEIPECWNTGNRSTCATSL